jgi:hypothetical protein
MADNNNPAGTPEGTGQPTGEPEGTPTSTVSNSDVKNSELFKKVTGEMHSELEQLRADKAQREKADADRKAEEERKALEAKGDFETALKLEQEKIAKLEDNYKKQLLERDVKNELLTVGINNDIFIKGAIASYTEETGSISDFAKKLAEENKHLINGANSRNTMPEPPKPGAGNGGAMTIDEAKSQKNSSDPKVASAARAVIGEYYDKHGRMP